jgi:hypothetical protein
MLLSLWQSTINPMVFRSGLCSILDFYCLSYDVNENSACRAGPVWITISKWASMFIAFPFKKKPENL